MNTELKPCHAPGSPQNPHKPGTAEKSTVVCLLEWIRIPLVGDHLVTHSDENFVTVLSVGGYIALYQTPNIPEFTFINEVRK